MHLVKLRQDTDICLIFARSPLIFLHFLDSRINGCGESFDGQKAISNDLIFIFTISDNLSLRLRPLLLLSLSLLSPSLFTFQPNTKICRRTPVGRPAGPAPGPCLAGGRGHCCRQGPQREIQGHCK